MDPFAQCLMRLVDAPDTLPSLVANARNVIAAVPELKARNYGDADVEQAVRAFRAMVREALEGSGSKTRDMFLETVIPAFASQGEPSSALVHGAASYVVMLAATLACRVEPEHQSDAIAFLAAFGGLYIRDVSIVASGGAK